MSQRPTPEASRQAGFTLIEVLVALAVCGFVVAAIAPVVGANALQARQANGRLALVAAERGLLEILPGRDQMRAGVRNGAMNGVNWRMRIVALPSDASIDPPSPWTAFHVIVDLTTQEGLANRVETVRLGKATPQ